MVNKWFVETFLPSVFDTVGAGKQKWLSAKQTAICTDNMAKHTVRYDGDGYGTMYNHDNYTCEWNGRQVFLQYSKKNGCGCIEFGYNAEEQATLNAEAEAERARIKRERIERIKRNPNDLQRQSKSSPNKLRDGRNNMKKILQTAKKNVRKMI